MPASRAWGGTPPRGTRVARARPAATPAIVTDEATIGAGAAVRKAPASPFRPGVLSRRAHGDRSPVAASADAAGVRTPAAGASRRADTKGGDSDEYCEQD